LRGSPFGEFEAAVFWNGRVFGNGVPEGRIVSVDCFAAAQFYVFDFKSDYQMRVADVFVAYDFLLFAEIVLIIVRRIGASFERCAFFYVQRDIAFQIYRSRKSDAGVERYYSAAVGVDRVDCLLNGGGVVCLAVYYSAELAGIYIFCEN
jgi:hypothetical protein